MQNEREDKIMKEYGVIQSDGNGVLKTD